LQFVSKQNYLIIKIAQRLFYILLIISSLAIIINWEGLLSQNSNKIIDGFYLIIASHISVRIFDDQNTLDTHKWGYVDEYDDLSIYSEPQDSSVPYITMHNTFSDIYSESLCSESNSRITTDKLDIISQKYPFEENEILELMEYYKNNPEYFYLDSEYEEYDYSMAWEEVKLK